MKITRQLRLDALAADGTTSIQLTISWEGNRLQCQREATGAGDGQEADGAVPDLFLRNHPIAARQLQLSYLIPMKLHLLATPLVAATLLLSTLGCSKKDDPTASAGGTSSYKLDGTTITCQSKAYVSSATSGGLTTDYLEIHLTTIPQPASGAETLKLYYYKQGGQPSSAYGLIDASLFTKGGTAQYYFTNYITTLSSTSGGGFSGAFSAKYSSPAGGTAPGPYTAITDGVFTDARP